MFWKAEYRLVHACNPSVWKVENQEFKANLSNIVSLRSALAAETFSQTTKQPFLEGHVETSWKHRNYEPGREKESLTQESD